jgi:membrane-associated HD superfamily phosphohydrolase
MQLFFLLGLYTARLELFKLLFFLSFGVLLWSFFLLYDASGSSVKKQKKRRAWILMTVSAILVLGMSVTWLLSKTNIGWWFDR